MLAKWLPPAGVNEGIVFGDNDAKYVGQASAFLARHASERGTKARVEIPEATGADWNKVYLEWVKTHRVEDFTRRCAA